MRRKNRSICYVFPLYLYPQRKQQNRRPNLKLDIIKQIAEKIDLRFSPEKTDDDNSFAPIDLLDYIYAALHSPGYRRKYHEFLKTDFPRVPYPAGKQQFRALAKLGAELRALHLMESAKLHRPITGYPEGGDNIVSMVQYQISDSKKRLGRVQISPGQYFTGIPEIAWNFHIGGYQPAQKYLKDRRGRALTSDEIKHYQKIIVALVETAAIMAQIDRLI